VQLGKLNFQIPPTIVLVNAPYWKQQNQHLDIQWHLNWSIAIYGQIFLETMAIFFTSNDGYFS
jgi:hypothetical protein